MWQNRILQVDCSDDLFFIVAPLLSLIRRHENDVVRNRLPESLRFQRHNVQRLLQRYVGQLRGNSPRCIVRIEHYRESRQLGHRIEDDPRVIGHLQIDRRAGERLQLRRTRHRFRLFLGQRGRRGSVFRRALGRNGIHGVLDFLLGNGTRRIDYQSLLKLRQSQLQIAHLEQLAALVHVKLTGLETHTRQLQFVFHVQRIGFKRAIVMHYSGVIVVNGLRLFPCIVLVVAFRTAGEDQQRQRGYKDSRIASCDGRCA